MSSKYIKLKKEIDGTTGKETKLQHCYSGWYDGGYFGPDYGGYGPYYGGIYGGWGGWGPGYDYYAKDAHPDNKNIVKAIQKDSIQIIQDTINYYRNLHSSPSMSEDPAISLVSQAWADHLLQAGLFEHSKNPNYGENLAYFQGYAFKGIDAVKKAVELWYDEVKLYDFANPGFSEATGHATQMLWHSSTKFGIGLAVDPGTDTVIVVFNNWVPGNVSGQYSANVFPAVSAPITPKPLPIPIPVPVIPIPNPLPNIPKPLPLPLSPLLTDLQTLLNQVYIGSTRAFLISKISELITKYKKTP